MARPSKLTRALQVKLCRLLRRGASVRSACEGAGLPQATFRSWMARGQAGDDPAFTRFRAAVVAARRAPLDKIEANVIRSGTRDARLGMQILAVRRPAKWGRGPTRIEATVDGRVTISLGEIRDTAERVRERARRILSERSSEIRPGECLMDLLARDAAAAREATEREGTASHVSAPT